MRPIDADALIEDIKSFWDWDSIDGITSTTVLKQTITDISHAPTIDAVPVVRCKDCRHYDNADRWCSLNRFICGKEDFCTWGRIDDGKSCDTCKHYSVNEHPRMFRQGMQLAGR